MVLTIDDLEKNLQELRDHYGDSLPLLWDNDFVALCREYVKAPKEEQEQLRPKFGDFQIVKKKKKILSVYSL